jgi:hypothetical protein
MLDSQKADSLEIISTPSRYTKMAATFKESSSAIEDVKGVMITSDGIIAATKVPRFRTFKIGKHHPVFKEHVCEVSALVGLPIKIIRYPTHGPDRCGYRTYQDATFLTRQCTSDTDNEMFDPSNWFRFGFRNTDGIFGAAPSAWQMPCGNVLAVREDGRDLAPEALQVLAEVSIFKLDGPIQQYYEETIGAKQVKEEMTKPVFMRYVEEYLMRENKENRLGDQDHPSRIQF